MVLYRGLEVVPDETLWIARIGPWRRGLFGAAWCACHASRPAVAVGSTFTHYHNFVTQRLLPLFAPFASTLLTYAELSYIASLSHDAELSCSASLSHYAELSYDGHGTP